MKRVLLLVMDSLGIGAASDADRFGDAGADTLGHIAHECMAGRAVRPAGRSGPLHLPNLVRLGLAQAAYESTGRTPPGLENKGPIMGAHGYAEQVSRDKDTPSGHWEFAGVPVTSEWGHFPQKVPAFPDALTQALIDRASLPGILGNRHASGTEIIKELGQEHVQTGCPICYTSVDSVFQIAAHESCFGLDRLYDLCQIARELVNPYRIARVIARPFVGDSSENFTRTANRRDYASPPPEDTLLDVLTAEGRSVIAVGKIADIFAHRGVSQTIKGDSNMALFDATLAAQRTAPDRSLVFTNFVDFDMLYGHRRHVSGYAHALEEFDARIPHLWDQLRAGDLVIITADHGCDPTWTGTDHTRERVPVLAFGPGVNPRSLGRRRTFSDIGQTAAQYLGVTPLPHGTSFLSALF